MKILLPIITFALLFIACKKEETALVGTWVTADVSAERNTIVFTEDLRAQKYFDHIFANQIMPAVYLPPYVNYSISGNKIKFTIYQSYPEAETTEQTFEYALNGSSLVIKGFSNPFSLTSEARWDVRFKKVK
jgi:hypothetical protein